MVRLRNSCQVRLWADISNVPHQQKSIHECCLILKPNPAPYNVILCCSIINFLTCPECMGWPLNSPNRNQIKHAWITLGRRLSEDPTRLAGQSDYVYGPLLSLLCLLQLSLPCCFSDISLKINAAKTFNAAFTLIVLSIMLATDIYNHYFKIV